jgi:Ca2+-binding RTX toxin-like protein
VADIIGTAVGETLVGTAGADRIEALGGDDIVRGEGGDDVILGGDGNDQLEGGAGHDRIEGGAGADYISGGPGDDTMIGGDGDDYFSAEEGSDIIDMGSGDNYASLFYGFSGVYNVQLTAGDGRDRIRLVSYGTTSFTMNLGGGNDEVGIELLGGNALLTLGTGSDTIGLTYHHPGSPTNPSNGVITVTDFETGVVGDTVDFLAGLTEALTNWDPTLNPFATGVGAGHLRLVQQGADSVLQIDRNGGANSFTTFMIFKNHLVSDFTPNNFDGFPTDGTIPAGLSILGTGGNDILTGWAGDDSLSGGGFYDSLYGGAGNDRLDGGDEGDSLYGELGDDLLNGGNDGDYLDGGRGDDILNGDDGNDYLRTDQGNDTLDGGTGNDTLYLYEVSAGTARGGLGDDSMVLYSNKSGALFALDGGDGSDRIEIHILRGRADVVLGAGADVLALGNAAPATLLAEGQIVVSDFVTGAGGDSVEMKLLLTALNGGWDGSANPFGSGHARLIQSGSDTLLQIDANGGGNSWQTAVTFTGRSLGSFTAANFEGYPPDGSPPAGLVLTGTAGPDNLRGGAGGDTIEGLGADDYLVGGPGGDTIRGGEANDSLMGEGGNDLLEGGSGNDRLDDGAGDDVSRGEDGDDNLWSDSGSDELVGGAGADTFTVQRDYMRSDIVTIGGGTGNDTAGLFIYGSSLYRADMGEGDDRITIYTYAGTVEMTLGAGADIVSMAGVNWAGSQILSILDFVAGAGGDRLDLNSYFSNVLTGWNGSDNPFTTGHARVFKSGSDMLLQVDRDGASGGEGFRTVMTLKNVGPAGFTADNFGWAPAIVTGETRTGTAGNDTLVTGDGEDTLDGGAGADTMFGGRGNDLYFVDNAGDSVREFSGEGTDEIRTTLATYSLLALPNVENLTANSNVDHDFRGNAGDNVITGGSGNDLFRLYDGGNDTVLAGVGADLFFFIGSLTSADVVNGGADADTLVVQGDYVGGLTLGANVTQIENVTILGGNNTSFGEPGTNLYDYVLTTNNANFAAGVQARINGAALLAGEDFTFDGSAETDASFVVYGGKGKDTLTGSFGNDVFIYAEERFAPGDTVNGGPGGYDGIFFRGNYTIDFNAPGYFGLMTSIENMTLTSITDERYARGGDPAGFDYNITLADNMLLAGVVLTVSGTFLGSGETMVVDGSLETDGNYRFFAGKADDVLKGGANNDLLLGNLGADLLTGGGGADTFRYDTTADSTATSLDHILDFRPGTDKIELTRTDANTLVAGNQAFTWIGSNAFSGTAGELRAFQQGGEWIVQGDANGDSVADLVIALTLQGPTPLGAGDFLL